MKRLLTSAAFAAVAALACTSFASAVFAEGDAAPAEAEVYVTISDKDGKLVLTQQPVTVHDIDNDGALTINDALYIAHEEQYPGGAAEGYGTEVGSYGLSVAKLWGTENGGSYGYYVNDIAAWSLVDPISSGDYLNAFVYTDSTGWSDSYSFFDIHTAEAVQGDELSLTLSRAGYDADWNPVTLPVEGAVISINGQATDAVTDAEGKVTVTITSAGQNLISAASDSVILVPPVAVVNAADNPDYIAPVTTASTEPAAEQTVTTAAPVEETTAATAAETSAATAKPSTTAAPATTTKPAGATESPKTGDSSGVLFALLGISAVTAAFTVRKHED